ILGSLESHTWVNQDHSSLMHLKGILQHNSSSHHLPDSSNRFLLEDMWGAPMPARPGPTPTPGMPGQPPQGPYGQPGYPQTSVAQSMPHSQPFPPGTAPTGAQGPPQPGPPQQGMPQGPPPQPGQPQPPYGGAPPCVTGLPRLPPLTPPPSSQAGPYHSNPSPTPSSAGNPYARGGSLPTSYPRPAPAAYPQGYQ
ncbi:hypothetical protein MTO96_032905, partial [Rhipicephalus appendiculatus]